MAPPASMIPPHVRYVDDYPAGAVTVQRIDIMADDDIALFEAG